MFTKIKLKLPLIGFIAILLLGLFSRLNIVNKFSLWYDEAFSGILVRQNLGTLIQIIQEDRVHPPVYYFLLKIWSMVWGNTDTALRFFSLIFGILLITAAFFLIKKMLNTKAALTAAGIFALSPYFILYSIEARSYIMLGLEALIAIYLFVKIINYNKKSFLEVYKLKETKWLLLISILILLTHYLGIVLILVMGILLFIKIYPKTEKFIWAILVGFFAIVIINGAIHNGNFRIFPKDTLHTRWLEDANLFTPGEMLYSFIFGVDSQAIQKQPAFTLTFTNDLNTVFLAISLASIIISLIYIKNKNSTVSLISKLFLFSFLLTSAVCLFGINIFIPRYVMFLAIIFIVWISSIVSTLNFKPFILAALVYLFLLTQIVWVNSNTNFENIPELEKFAEDKRILVKSPFDYLVLKYYLNDNRNLFFLDSEYWHMKETPWPFFHRSQITDKTLEGDKII